MADQDNEEDDGPDPKLYNRDWIKGNIYGLRDYQTGSNEQQQQQRKKIPNKKESDAAVAEEADAILAQEEANGNESSSSYQSKNAVVISCRGLVDMDDPLFGEHAKPGCVDQVMLRRDDSGLPVEKTTKNNNGEWEGAIPTKSVFTGLPFKSCLFRYNILEATEMKGKAMGYNTVYKVDKYELEALPLTVNRLRFLLTKCLRLSLNDAENVVVSGIWAYDSEIYKKTANSAKANLNARIDFSTSKLNPEYIIKLGDGGVALIEDAIFSVFPERCEEMMKEIMLNVQCKIYFFNKQYKVISAYYGSDKTTKMPHDQFTSLAETLLTRPHLLCFRKILQFMWLPDTSDGAIATKAKKKNMLKLPELTLDTLQTIMKEHRDTCVSTYKDVLKVKIYTEMKSDYAIHRNTYSSFIYLSFKCDPFLMPPDYMVLDHDGSNGKRKPIISPKVKSAAAIAQEKLATFQEAITWLSSQYIIVDDQGQLFLREAFKNEMTIAQCLEKVINKAIAHMTTNNNMEDDADDTENVVPLHQYTEEQIQRVKSQLCSEQLRALHHHLSNPILILNGKGGCGKTKFLSEFASLYKKGKVFATAFQGSNSGSLHNAVDGYAFTSHMLIYNHDSSCPRSPYYRPGAVDIDNTSLSLRKMTRGEKLSRIGIPYKECIYENVEVLIIDEASTMYPELLAKLLAGMVTCGKLKSIIMAGDIAQLGSMHPGNIARDMWSALSQLHCAMEFHHNHRSTDFGLGVLGQTTLAIRSGRPNGLRFDNKTCLHVDYEEPYKTKFQSHTARQIKPGTISEINNIEDCIEFTLDFYKIPEYEHHIVTRTRAVRDRINKRVEDYYLKLAGKESYPFPHVVQYVGRKYLFKKNNYEKDIVNGEVLVLVEIGDYRDTRTKEEQELKGSVCTLVHVGQLIHMKHSTFDPVAKGHIRRLKFMSMLNNKVIKEVIVDEWYKKWIHRGYATTIHAFQGLQIHTVLDVVAFKHIYETQEGRYTADSRPTSRLFMVGRRESIDKSITNPEPKRSTGLADKILYFCLKYQTVFNAYGHGTKLDDPEDVASKLKEEEEAERIRLRIENGEDEEEEEAEESNELVSTPPSPVAIPNEELEVFPGYSGGIPLVIWLQVFKHFLYYPGWIEKLMSLRRISKDWDRMCTSNAIWVVLFVRLVPEQYIPNHTATQLTLAPSMSTPRFFYDSFKLLPIVKAMDIYQCYCNTSFRAVDAFHKVPVLELPHGVATHERSLICANCKKEHKFRYTVKVRHHPNSDNGLNRITYSISKAWETKGFPVWVKLGSINNYLVEIV